MFDATKKSLQAGLSKKIGKEVDYATVSGLVALACLTGQATEIGNEPRPAGTKGKPSKVYRFNDQFALNLADLNVETVKAVAPAVVVATEANEFDLPAGETAVPPAAVAAA